MAKTKQRKRIKPSGRKSLFDLPVSFGNVNVGDKTARLGVTIDRGERALTVQQADKSLCERRLTGRVVAKPAGSQSDQDSLPGMDDDIWLDGIFDVKGVSFTGDDIKIGLTMAIKSIKVEDLAHFAKRAGRLQIFDVEEIPAAERAQKTDSDPDEDEESDDEGEGGDAAAETNGKAE